MSFDTPKSITKKYRQHYFIGAVFNNREQIQDLVRVKKTIKGKLKSKYELDQHGYHSNFKFSTNLVYLGYLEENIAEKYMENIFDSLLKELTQNIQELECQYTDFTISNDNSFYRISIDFKDTEDKLNQVILPYLNQEGIKPIYPNRTIEKPKIELLYVNKKKVSYFEKRNFYTKLPSNSFKLDYLTLIKGIPTVSRSGSASVHDQMNLEEVEKYKYYFLKSSNNQLVSNPTTRLNSNVNNNSNFGIKFNNSESEPESGQESFPVNTNNQNRNKNKNRNQSQNSSFKYFL
jgi:hypothetical protein